MYVAYIQPLVKKHESKIDNAISEVERSYQTQVRPARVRSRARARGAPTDRPARSRARRARRAGGQRAAPQRLRLRLRERQFQRREQHVRGGDGEPDGERGRQKYMTAGTDSVQYDKL